MFYGQATCNAYSITIKNFRVAQSQPANQNSGHTLLLVDNTLLSAVVWQEWQSVDSVCIFFEFKKMNETPCVYISPLPLFPLSLSLALPPPLSLSSVLFLVVFL